MKRPLCACVLLFCMSAAAAEIVVWHPYRGAAATVLEELATQFANHGNGPPVRLVARPPEEMIPLFDDAAARGDLPDAIIANHEHTGRWVIAGRILPLPLPFAGHIAELTFPSAVEALRYDGRSWGIPLTVSTVVLFRRTDIAPHAPATTGDLLAAARAWVGNDDERSGLAFDTRSIGVLRTLLSGFGGGLCMSGPIVTERPCVENDGNGAALSFLAGLVDDRLLPAAADRPALLRWFAEGRIPFVLADQSFASLLPAATPFAAAPLPVISETGLPMRPSLKVEALYLVNGPRADTAAAMRFGEFLAATRGARLRAVRGGQTVATLLTYDEVELHDDPFFALVRQQADIAEPLSSRSDMPLLAEPLRNAVRAVLQYGHPPQTALSAAIAEYDEALHPPSLERRIALSALVLLLLFLPAVLFSRIARNALHV